MKAVMMKVCIPVVSIDADLMGGLGEANEMKIKEMRPHLWGRNIFVVGDSVMRYLRWEYSGAM